jgi:hypothetical protein
MPHGTNRRASGTAIAGKRRHSTEPRAAALPPNWRGRLPDPANYYAAHVERLGRPNVTGWAQGKCPFHDDCNASLSVHVAEVRGGWRCFAGCGGGDLVGFHSRLTGKPFKDAVADLLRWRA